MPGNTKNREQWSAEVLLAVIVETATLSEPKLAEYWGKGLYPEQIMQWKQAFLQVPAPEDNALLKQRQK
ncbi:hypothetical protein PCO85_14095 [Prodigiosinella aquatilis]|nr:hypothetical protein [Prodigiosinella sp. LS101]WJV52365.1 hypothetical protein PCO85_14095 [Prodigiosinella sp. LS101]WJV56719.1 hypothetical protein PCO84_14080 [Pectobacteriaceae bacterium C111]